MEKLLSNRRTTIRLFRKILNLDSIYHYSPLFSLEFGIRTLIIRLWLIRKFCLVSYCLILSSICILLWFCSIILFNYAFIVLMIFIRFVAIFRFFCLFCTNFISQSRAIFCIFWIFFLSRTGRSQVCKLVQQCYIMNILWNIYCKQRFDS